MKFHQASLLIVLAMPCELIAQNTVVGSGSIDFSTAIGKNQHAAALGYARVNGFGKHSRLRLGYGVRFTSYFGKQKDFITAPARLTSRQTGPQVIFSKTYNESLDTVRFEQAQINFMNITIHLGYRILKKIDIEFNIDAIGFSFGRQQVGTLRSTLRPETLKQSQLARPTSFNLLLVSDNDLGSLNSEFIVRYPISEQLGMKAGFCFLFAEYTTHEKLIFDNDRFRNKASMAMLGLGYTLKTKNHNK